MLKIDKINIGLDYKPVIVAEMSGNHNQSFDRAIKIVEAAAAAGVQMLKLQTYTADTMTLDIEDGDFLIKDKNFWTGQTLHELYKKAYTPWEWHKPIMKRAKELNIVCFSSAFDESAVDFLEKLNVPAYKIASFENTDLPLIKKVAKTGKPIIVSTGMATFEEIKEAVETIKNSGCKNYILLKCTSAYPAASENSNILTIPDLRKLFNCEVGLSDHTLGIGSALAAVAHGATVIEKHFTLNKSDIGVDSGFSIEPHEMKILVNETENVWRSLGKVSYGPTEAEKPSLKFRRSLYVAKDIEVNQKFTKENLRIIRPGNGLAPKYYNQVLGRKVNKKLKKGTAVKWDYLQ
jgi:N-acetylneuraminate synthase